MIIPDLNLQKSHKITKNYEVDYIKNPQNFMTLLQEEDEVLDYSIAASKLEDTELIIEEGGNHSLMELRDILEK